VNVAIPKRLDKLTVVCYPDPVLKKRCRPVEEFGEQLSDLAHRMLALMHQGDGIGLAAPQVGILIRMFVYNVTGEPEDDGICINPTLSDAKGSHELEEGCLSLPGVEVPVRRATTISIRAQDVFGSQFEQTGSELLARVWQHETDHLDGRLIIDNMSEAAKIANRRAIKQLQDEYKPRPRRK